MFAIEKLFGLMRKNCVRMRPIEMHANLTREDPFIIQHMEDITLLVLLVMVSDVVSFCVGIFFIAKMCSENVEMFFL